MPEKRITKSDNLSSFVPRSLLSMHFIHEGSVAVESFDSAV